MMNLKQDLVDALPYIDQGYDDEQNKKAILYMIDEETRRYRKTKNYLEFLGKEDIHRFETELIKNEFERIEKDGQLQKFDMSRYELPEPFVGKQRDVTSWQKCLENTYAQLEQQNFRVFNLKLLESYGTEAWKTYNNVLEKLIQYNEKKLVDVKRKIQETNYERKTSQEKAGEKLKHLEANWVSLVSKNFEIEQACCNLDYEIRMLEKYHKFCRPGQEDDEPKAKRQKINENTQEDDENIDDNEENQEDDNEEKQEDESNEPVDENEKMIT